MLRVSTIAAALLLLAAPASAQNSYLYLSNATQTSVDLHIGVRTTITGFTVQLPTRGFFDCYYPIFQFLPCNLGDWTPMALVGNVDTSPFAVSTPWGPVTVGQQFRPFTRFGNSTYFFNSAYYTSADVNLGVVGCTRPAAVDGLFIGFAGRICPEEGFDGFLEYILTYTPDPMLSLANPLRNDARTYSASDFGVSFQGGAPNIAQLVAPEPSTWALMAAGLVAIGVVRRRRLATGAQSR